MRYRPQTGGSARARYRTVHLVSGFVGEFLILLGTFSSDVLGSPVLVAVATSGVVFAAYYLLWLVYKVFFGPIDRDENRTMSDLNRREIALLIPLAIFMVWIGVAPAKFLEVSETSTNAIIETVEIKRMAMEENPDARRILLPDELLASRQ